MFDSFGTRVTSITARRLLAHNEGKSCVNVPDGLNPASAELKNLVFKLGQQRVFNLS
jgi:hypothetical protein